MGVKYYHMDYVGLRKRFYSAAGGMLATAINYEGLPPVAPEFDAAALRANILDRQRHGQPYREFTRRGPCRTGHRVGVQGYIVFLRGQRVTYWGRTGDQHTEWFPGVRAGLAIGANGELKTPHPACGQPNLGMALPGPDQLLTRPSCCCITEGKL